jgi:hypothetical protein
MGWAARSKHRGAGQRNRVVKMTPEALAALVPNLAELDKMLAGVANEQARAQLRRLVEPKILAKQAASGG